MAKVAIRKDELELVLETARRAAKRTNSIVVIAEERLDITEGEGSQVEAREDHKPVTLLN